MVKSHLSLRRGLLGLGAMLGLGALALTPASAQLNVGYFTDFNAGSTAPQAGITANGYTAIQITNITTANFGAMDMIVINESSNGSPSGALQGRFADLETFVMGGGKLVVHDRNVNQGAVKTLPALLRPGMTFNTAFLSSIDILTPGTLVTNGPFGTLTNTSLDGGNWSEHGYVDASSMPAGSVNILDTGNASQIVAALYGIGSGFVYYSTSPLDFYLAGGGPNPPRNNFTQIYYPNVLAYVGGQQNVPEPGAYALLCGLAVPAVGFVVRRRRKRG